jgi:uncharacterized Fe-S cluster protein YjdI
MTGQEVPMKHEFRGEKIVVHYDDDVCTHAGECVGGLPAVFDVKRKPWINPDDAAPEAVERAVAGCPSGALSSERV